MRCERLLVFALLLAACSRETPAPEATTTTAANATTSRAATARSSTQPPVLAAPARGTYAEAITWFRSAPGFRFVLDEEGLHAEGTMTRSTIGAEVVELRANGEEWRATATPQGVTWERREQGRWKAATAPPFGNHLYQRVTVAFDPQKKEGTPQLISSEGDTHHYRFTNANTGEVHDVWVSQASGRIERMRIGERFELKISA